MYLQNDYILCEKVFKTPAKVGEDQIPNLSTSVWLNYCHGLGSLTALKPVQHNLIHQAEYKDIIFIVPTKTPISGIQLPELFPQENLVFVNLKDVIAMVRKDKTQTTLEDSP